MTYQQILDRFLPNRYVVKSDWPHRFADEVLQISTIDFKYSNFVIRKTEIEDWPSSGHEPFNYTVIDFDKGKNVIENGTTLRGTFLELVKLLVNDEINQMF